MSNLFIETVAVGIMTVIFGNLTGLLVGSFYKVDLPEVCSNLNKFYTMEITLLFTGVFIHLFFEF